jgi:hypothetical protein
MHYDRLEVTMNIPYPSLCAHLSIVESSRFRVVHQELHLQAVEFLTLVFWLSTKLSQDTVTWNPSTKRQTLLLMYTHTFASSHTHTHIHSRSLGTIFLLLLLLLLLLPSYPPKLNSEYYWHGSDRIFFTKLLAVASFKRAKRFTL